MNYISFLFPEKTYQPDKLALDPSNLQINLPMLGIPAED